jgi:hypothetical protein
MMDDQNRDDPDRLDLTLLDPRADGLRFEQLVRDVRRAATPELVRRQAGPTLWGQIARWRRPIFAVSGLVALASTVVLAVVQPSATAQTTMAEAIGLPGQVARWVQASDKPTPGDLLGLERSQP